MEWCIFTAEHRITAHRKKSDTFSKSDPVYRSHLFTLRLWREDLGNGQAEWRGKVEYVPSREARYFREWSTLIAFLLEVLPQMDLQSGCYYVP
jgi:hypothetical protein